MDQTLLIPADVPASAHDEYRKNYEAITQGTGRLMLFAADQKIEHLNQDFYGTGIDPQAQSPEHLFRIASQGRIGAFATHLGLVAQYGPSYTTVNYLIKLNGKTNVVPTQQRDPMSALLWTVDDVVALKKQSGLPIRGVGLTVYIGSEYESTMLATAARVIAQAHQQGLITLVWMYPRGKAVTNERDGALIAGGAGVAAALGTDFAKINPPQDDKQNTGIQWLAIAAQAAGRTKLVCSGGTTVDPKLFLQELYAQITNGGMNGNATGRNIFAYDLNKAIAMTKAIAAITLDGKKPEEVTLP